MGKTAQAPDYTGAANTQAQSSKEVTNQQTWANRPTLNTPWGSQTWQTQATTDPATGQAVTQWTGNINLTPEQQQALDSQQAIQQGRSDMGLSMMDQANQAISKPFDFGASADAGKNGANAMYSQMTSRLDPQWSQKQNQEQSWLANQGLDPTSAAWQTDMGNFNRAQTDAYNQANYQSTMAGQQYEAGDMSLQAQQRTLPLNMMNAELTGQQVQNPQMPGFSQAQASQPVQALSAATAAGNFNLANAESQNQLYGSALQGAGSAIGAFSDERLKTDVHRQDEEAMPGVPFATWEYKHDPHKRKFKGVIAQDVEKVRPDKVHQGPGGYKMVDADLAPFSFGKKRN